MRAALRADQKVPRKKVSLFWKAEVWVIFIVISTHLNLLRPSYVHCRLIFEPVYIFTL